MDIFSRVITPPAGLDLSGVLIIFSHSHHGEVAKHHLAIFATTLPSPEDALGFHHAVL